MADFRMLASSLRQRAAIVSSAVTQLQIDIAEAILDELESATPVLTGRAQENWHVAIGAPADRFDATPGKHLRSTVEEHRKAVARIVRSGLRDLGIQPGPGQGGAIYIDNAVPYILKLLHGESRQAPPGWVEEAVKRGVARGLQKQSSRNIGVKVA
jgi:hypothetical protein